MAFSISGSLITATSGSETVATLFSNSVNGSPAADSGTFFDRLGDTTQYFYFGKSTAQLAISSGASFTVANNSLSFGEASLGPTIANSGTLTIGLSTVSGSNTIYQDSRCTVKFPNNGASTTNAAQASIQNLSGGTLRIFGADVYAISTMHWESGSTVDIRNSVIQFASSQQIRCSTSNVTIEGLELIGGTLTLLANPSSVRRLVGLLNTSATGVVSLSTVSPEGSYFFPEYDSAGVNTDFIIATASGWTTPNILYLDNPLKAASNLVFGYSATASAQAGIAIVRRFLDYTIVASSGAGIQDGRIYLLDTNNGARVSASRGGVGNYSADISYDQVSNSSGVFPQIQLITAIRSKPNVADAVPSLDSRTPFNGLIAAYGYNLYPISGFDPSTNIDSSGKVRPIVSKVQLTTDVVVTEPSRAIVAGYSTNSSITINKIYDYALYDKTLSTGIRFPTTLTKVIESSDGTNASCRYNLLIDSTLSGIAINHGTLTLSVKNLTGGTFGRLTLAASRTVTLAQAGTYSAPLQVPATGVVVVASGATNLSAWAFASGATINVSSGTATVTVASVSGITAGAGVTLVIPPASLLAENVADGCRFFAARYQTFKIQSADISSPNVTLGLDEETGAVFAGTATSPATLLELNLATGATMPTTTPQLVSGNLYYCKSNSSGVIQISETEGGTAITFTNTGTQNGSGELFTLIARTQLINQVVSGGVSVPLTLPDGAILEVAIQGYATTTASELFTRLVEWDSASGASIPDEFSITNNPDALFNRLIGATLTNKRGISITVTSDPATVPGLAFDVSGNIELDANAILNGTLLGPDAYVWSVFVRSTESGIRVIRRQFTALSVMEFQLDKLLLDNIADGVRNSPATPLNIYANIVTKEAQAEIYAPDTGTIKITPFFTSDITSAGDGSFTTADRNKVTAIYGTLESSGGTTEKFTPASQSAVGTAITTATSGLSTLTAAQVWSYAGADRTLTGTQASNLAAIPAIPTNPLLTTDARLNNLDATISSRSTYAGGDTAGITTLLVRATEARLAKLDVSGSLSTLTATQVWEAATRSLTDKAGFALSTAGVAAIEAALINEGDGQQLVNAIVQVINSNLDLPALELAAIADAVRSNLATELGRIDQPISSRLASTAYTAPTNLTAAQVWANADRTLTGTQASNLAAIPAIPTNPLLATDARLNNLDATITSRSTFNPATTAVTVGGYSTGQSPSVLVDLAEVATTAQVNAARDAVLTQGNAAWVTATGFSTLTTGDLATALNTYGAAKPEDVQVTVEPTPVTVSGGFLSGDRADLVAAKNAAEAVADGQHTINYTDSTATQFNADGTPRTVFDLLDAEGNPATSGQTAVERVPQP